MRSLFIILASAVLLAGCGSGAADTASNSGSRVGVNGAPANGANTIASSDGSPSSTAPAGIPSDPSAQQPLPEAETAPAGSIAAANTRRPIVDGPPPPKGAKPPTSLAPENSTISSVMNKDGSVTTTREFRLNEYFRTLEVTANGNKRDARLILLNGKSVPLPYEKVAKVSSITVAELMALAHITPRPPKISVKPRDPNAPKKEDN